MRSLLSFAVFVLVSNTIPSLAQETYNVTVGSEFTIKATQIDDISQFAKKPKVYVKEDETTRKKKTIKVTNKGREFKNGLDEITCQWKKKVTPGTYILFVQPKAKGEKYEASIVSSSFIIEEPSITKITIDEQDSEDDYIWGTATLTGQYFGNKKPKVWIEFIDPNRNKLKGKRCKVHDYSMTSVNFSYDNIPDIKCTIYLKNKISTCSSSFNDSTKAQLTMTVTPSSSGTTSPTTGTSTVTIREAQIITATAANGYAFTSWTGDPAANATIADANSASTTVTLTGDATVTATFTAQGTTTATLTMAVSPDSSGTTSPTAGSSTVNTNEAISISATAANGYYFSSWTASPSGNASFANANSATTTVTLSGDATVTAQFSTTPSETIYYVAKDGNDSNDGSSSSPWLTIQKAATTLQAGETVYIKSGIYTERVTPANSGSSGSYITYMANPGDTVTVDGTDVTVVKDTGLFDVSERSYIKVSGLKVTNSSSAAIYGDNCSYITIENNYTYNSVESGIGIWNSNNISIYNNEVELACNDGEQECITVATTDTFSIYNNHVHDNGPGTNGGEGIDVKDGAKNGSIYNNKVHDLNNRLGIYVDSWDKETTNIKIYQNLVYNVKKADAFTIAAESGGLLSNVYIYNNIAYNCEMNGISISRNGTAATHPMKTIHIINNTFYKNGSLTWGGAISVDNKDIEGVIIRNNLCYDNVYYQIEVEKDVPTAQLTIDHNLVYPYRDYEDEVRGTDYVEADPLLINAAGGDFKLQSTSPAIDKGSSSDAPSTDYEGTTRPQGSAVDIGAYEYK